MSYQVIARKWRPQQFDDVVGQGHVTRTLKNAIQLDRVAHAYLFVGPRGTGKTTTARIFAKALNCEQGPTVTPCDRCDACREIMAGNSLDVLEIDGASNNGVDQVRELRQNVQYAPARGPYKIYVIDEVHMLSIAAFNALLKTLEEPPRHVKFVFATTEPQKVPSTILSRCQRFDLRRIPIRDIVERLTAIVRTESLDVTEDALLAVARGADGGMRDAQSALDQLIAFRGERITEEDVLSVFGLVSWNALETLAEAVLCGDVSAALRVVGELDKEGKDLHRLLIELLDYFRTLLVCAYTGGDAEALDLSEMQLESVRRRAEGLEPGRVLRVVELLTETEGRMRTALSQRTLVEAALIRAARASTTVTIDELIRQVEALRHEGGAGGLEAGGTGAPSGSGTGGGGPVEAPAAGPAGPPRAGGRRSRSTPDGGGAKALRECWSSVVDEVAKTAQLAAPFLRTCRPLRDEGGTVVVGYPPGQESMRARAETERAQRAIRRAVAVCLGRDADIAFQASESLEAGEADEEPGRPAAAEQPPGEFPDAANRWFNEPSVRKVLESFNGDILDVTQR